MRHFLSLNDLTKDELSKVLYNAIKSKEVGNVDFSGKVLGMVFEKPSTRTRVSFEAGFSKFGGSAIFLSQDVTQMKRGEPMRDTARVLGRYCDILMARVYSHVTLLEMRDYAGVPVLNGLSDLYHPCQAVGDLLTILEHVGTLQGTTLAYVGDGNNVATSLMRAGGMTGMNVRIACPKGYEPDMSLVRLYGDRLQVVHDPAEAVADADVVYTDVWTSMGDEGEFKKRFKAFQGYTVDATLMGKAKRDAKVMHCLPAHRGEEITDEVIEGDNSIVFDQAENRMHAQVALMDFLLDE